MIADNDCCLVTEVNKPVAHVQKYNGTVNIQLTANCSRKCNVITSNDELNKSVDDQIYHGLVV